MRKLIGVGLAVVLLLTMGTIPVFAANGNGNGANDININGFHYTINIVGKKADWNGNGDYDHGSTIFVPANSEGMSFTAPDGSTIDGIRIDVADGNFAVIDGNAFDGEAAFMLPKDRYSVWICMRGKPDPDLYANIDGWVYDAEQDTSLLHTGTFNVSRKWKDATEDLLFVDASAWGLGSHEYVFDLDYDAYFWSLLSNGAKLIKVRIYPE